VVRLWVAMLMAVLQLVVKLLAAMPQALTPMAV
jgi:hypothetical protein